MRQKFLKMICSFMALLIFVGIAACGPQYDEVDENDYSRWIIRFTSEYPSSLPEERIELSIQELKKEDFTIDIYYDPAYQEMAEADIDFTLEPKTELFYVDDDGEQIELGNNLTLEKHYYFIRDMLYVVLDNGQMNHSQRIFGRGEYLLDYAFCNSITQYGMPGDIIAMVRININVTNKENGKENIISDGAES